MPSLSRDTATVVSGVAVGGDLRTRAVAVLTDPGLAHVVDLVAYVDGEDLVVTAARGTARYSRASPDAPPRLVDGENPIALQDPLVDDSRCYPFAARRLASLFLDPRAPDLAVVHTGGHYWPERDGHLGEHGSLNAIQSRAPLVISGAGVAARGALPRAARTVDVAATLAAACGASYDGMDGSPLLDLVSGGAARHVVGLLWDGAQCADLLAQASAGELPAVRRLLDRGVALVGGAIAEFPSVTLVNHTSALTGVGPGRHGIVNNSFYDREIGKSLVPNSAAMWHQAMSLLRPGVSTVFERIAVARPGAVTACVNDPVDTGATYSTFALLRATGDAAATMRSALPDPTADVHASLDQVGASGDYSWATQVDASGLDQVLGLWTVGQEPPAFTWWNTTLTDTGHHAGGPTSAVARATMRDADTRLGVWLDRVEELGLLDDTLVVLTADHGSEAADPDCRGDWDVALTDAGIPFRDEGYGFIYLGV